MIKTGLKSPLETDIRQISRDAQAVYKETLKIAFTLHTEDEELTYRDRLGIMDIMIHDDYLNNIGHYIELTLMVPYGTYLKRIQPYLDNMEMTLVIRNKKDPLADAMFTDRFRVFPVLESLPDVGNTATFSMEDLDNRPPITIKLQLLDRAVEALRIKTIGNNFDLDVAKNSMLAHEMLKTIYVNEALKIRIDNKPILQAVEVDEADNTEPVKSFLVPSYTHLTELAETFQNEHQGVYSTGIGVYVQKYRTLRTLFIYNLYRFEDYYSKENKIMIFVPDHEFNYGGATYHYNENEKLARIVTLANTQLTEVKPLDTLNKGTGIRTSNAYSYLKKPVDFDPDQQPVFKRKQLDTEFTLGERNDGLNYAVRSDITINFFKHASEITANKMRYIKLSWAKSNPFLFYPGAKVMVYYPEKTKMKSKLASLIKSTTYIEIASPNILKSFNREYNEFTCNTDFILAYL